MLEIDGDLIAKSKKLKWLVTGAAGFIGSNITEYLLNMGCEVVGLDNFESGFQHNLDAVRGSISDSANKRFSEIEGNICNFEDCLAACEGIDVIIHLAALGSVPSSIERPEFSTAVNVGGFVNLLTAARDRGIRRFVYASSCSVYGNEPALPKHENLRTAPLSPYALSKLTNEAYAQMFGRCFEMETIGLRFFNVYGPRQDPHGPYAAVIPLWFESFLRGEPIYINGDGSTSRDFIFVGDVATAAVQAGTVAQGSAANRTYNIGSGKEITLNQLTTEIANVLLDLRLITSPPPIVYREFRAGDVLRSRADISAAQTELNFQPQVNLLEGLHRTADYFLACRTTD